MISIVLPTYNGQKYIGESVESIINQTYADWELVIVDDCSTDDTPGIVDGFAEKDDRISVIHNKINRKLPAALNVGFQAAKGELLTWTSDDNKYYPDALEVMERYLSTKQNCPMVCTAYCFMDPSGKEYGRALGYDKDFVYYNDCVGACFLYRRSVLETIGEYDESFFCAEDYEYWLRVLRNCGEIDFIDEIHYAYRMHDASLTATRWLQIKTALNRIRERDFDFLFSRLQVREDLFSGLYFDMLFTDSLSEERKKRFMNKLPYASMFLDHLDDDSPLIIYGAGEFGDKIYELVKDRAVAYADRDEKKQGQYKNGLPIISISEMIERARECFIVLAIDSRYVYEVARNLYNLGVRVLGSYQQVLMNRRMERIL